ncbi:hypothetical protein ACHAXA_003500 [Cyclostephanos tholiformis]|uniref:3-hydroxyacyl-[acyl-carrier-protein] dehydratase n=1 Tax=Cyclostephanos tholiformis TaxID=382380 RepID=A0ABD3SF79_9STRA
MKLALLVAAALASTSTAFLVPPQTTTTTASSSSTRIFGKDKDKDAPVLEAPTKPRSAEEISSLTSTVKTVFSLEDINGILPHRYPFLLVDKVVEYEVGKSAVGIKCVTLNEPHFTGHFPNRPIMPGVLQVEALAQLAGIVCLQMEGAEPGAVFFFAGVDGVKWKRPVVPGDTLVMEVEIKKWNKRFGIATAKGRAYVDGEMAIELDEMKFALAK